MSIKLNCGMQGTLKLHYTKEQKELNDQRGSEFQHIICPIDDPRFFCVC